ncbi:MAG: hypothetical protein RLZZ517_422 [Candidatus Parcubacteria bacterium]
MKYIYIPAVFFLMFSFVSAEEQKLSLPQNREEIKQKIEEKKSEVQNKIEEKRAEIKGQIQQVAEEQKTEVQIFAQERILKILQQIFEKFDAVLVKFDGISERIDIRISKNEENGLDMTKQKELLAAAKENILQSTALVAATKIELDTLIKSATFSKEQIKKSVDVCKESLKTTQKSLVDVIESLKLVGDISSDNLIFEE